MSSSGFEHRSASDPGVRCPPLAGHTSVVVGGTPPPISVELGTVSRLGHIVMDDIREEL